MKNFMLGILKVFMNGFIMIVSLGLTAFTIAGLIDWLHISEDHSVFLFFLAIFIAAIYGGGIYAVIAIIFKLKD